MKISAQSHTTIVSAIQKALENYDNDNMIYVIMQ